MPIFFPFKVGRSSPTSLPVLDSNMADSPRGGGQNTEYKPLLVITSAGTSPSLLATTGEKQAYKHKVTVVKEIRQECSMNLSHLRISFE